MFIFIHNYLERCSTCLKKQPNPSGIVYVLTVWQLGHIVHILKYLIVAFKFIMSSYCQWSHGIVSYNLRWAVQHDNRVWYMHALLIILTSVGLISWRQKWGMYGGREKLHILLQLEKTCICLSDRYKFSPNLHRQHIYYLVSISFKYCHVFQG